MEIKFVLIHNMSLKLEKAKSLIVYHLALHANTVLHYFYKSIMHVDINIHNLYIFVGS